MANIKYKNARLLNFNPVNDSNLKVRSQQGNGYKVALRDIDTL